MNKVSLKVVVAGRTYPLTVQESEVEKVQKSAEEINKAIKQLQENFAVRDMQDLLAMTALQLSTKNTRNTIQTVSQEADFSSTEDALRQLLDEMNRL